MARPPLPIGTWGAIRTEKLGPNRYCARARYRDHDGKTRDVEATDTTGPAAIRALKIKLRDRVAPNDDEITRETHISTLAALWLEEIAAEERISPQSISRYEISVRVSIVPALGNLRIREANAGRLDKFLRKVAEDRPSAAKSAKVVLGQMFALAVRRGALTTNPIRDTGQLRKPRKKVVALEMEQLDDVRSAIRQWQQPTPGKSGPRPTSDLADIVDLLLATGARIGEILALRWEDLDLAVEHPVLTISGTIIYIKGKGFFRQEWTKTDAGYRSVVLPKFAVAMLMTRKLNAADNPNDAIFPSRRGTWLSPPNVRRQWRAARADTSLEWVTPHTFRKTVATLIDKEANTDSAAAQLGHKTKETTKKHYIVKPAIAPDSSNILEQLGGRPEPGDPEHRYPGQSRTA
ncbi:MULTISPECIES: site-specific integrase [unclassified Micromonospora]|uniref:tyrosine-type recombinase/integrase n=1 Tax=unclassified Micromonospora TaxID=2617518 RepID=UPI00098D0CED|nr:MULTISPECIES: site-specific integrase [unclassified Micromonospora]MDI5937667.1 site-specific integrase [Micromonospora sp. DH15]OON32055.1 site-specific integrase [Micromonospora sp. Rc5]